MLSSVKIISLESQTLLRTPCSGEFQNGYFSLPLIEDQSDFFFFFSGVHYEKLVELLKVKLIKVWGPHCDWVPGDFISQVSPNWASNNSWTTAQVFLTLVLVPVEVGFCAVKLGSPYLPVSPIFTEVYPVTSLLWQMAKELLIFHFFQLFTCS